MIVNIIDTIFKILNILIILRVIISWLAPTSRNEFTDFIYMATEPLLRPFRSLIPMGQMRIDFSPILAYFALAILKNLIFRLM